MRKTFFGFVPMWAFDNIVALINVIGGATKEGMEKFVDTMSVLSGGNLPWNQYVIKPMAKKVIEETTGD